MTTAISKAGNTFLAPKADVQYEDTAQKLDTNHFSPPLLNILQKGSPQVEEGRAEYITGAKPGDMHNTVSDEIFTGKDGVVVIPCAVDRYFTEWGPRDEGGGFKGRHLPSSPVVQAAQRKPHDFGKLSNGKNPLVETFVVFGILYQDDENYEPVIIPFTSTKITEYKKFVQKMNQVKQNGKSVAFYNHAFRFKTKLETRPKGSSFNFDIDWLNENAQGSRLDPHSALFAACREFAEMANVGNVQVNNEASQDSSEEVPF